MDNPDLVSDTWLNFASAIWFYLNPQPPKPSMLAITDQTWKPNNHDLNQNRKPGNISFSESFKKFNFQSKKSFPCFKKKNFSPNYNNSFCAITQNLLYIKQYKIIRVFRPDQNLVKFNIMSQLFFLSKNRKDIFNSICCLQATGFHLSHKNERLLYSSICPSWSNVF